MVKRYSLSDLLQHTANKEDIDHQASNIQQTAQGPAHVMPKVTNASTPTTKHAPGEGEGNKLKESFGGRQRMSVLWKSLWRFMYIMPSITQNV